MIDWINALLRAIMCLGFLIFVVKPMLLVFSRREFNHMELEDAAQSSVNSAFQAWRINHGKHYYDNPEYAEMMASNPNLELPDLSKPPEQLPPPEVKAEDSFLPILQQRQYRHLRQRWIQPIRRWKNLILRLRVMIRL